MPFKFGFSVIQSTIKLVIVAYVLYRNKKACFLLIKLQNLARNCGWEMINNVQKVCWDFGTSCVDK